MRAALGIVLVFAVAAGAHAAPRPLIGKGSEITFSVKQMGVAVNGHFTRFSAAIDIDPAAPATATAQVEVEIASLATGEPEADTEALAPAWLDARGFPKATFTSTSVRALGGPRYEARGTLTIKGQPRALTLPLTLTPLPGGGLKAAGEFTLRRTDFGVGGGEWNDQDLVANEVPVRFALTLGPPTPATEKEKP